MGPTRAVRIPGLKSAPESDFGAFWTSDHDDFDSGSFSLESLESAPVVESAPVLKSGGIDCIARSYFTITALNIVHYSIVKLTLGADSTNGADSKLGTDCAGPVVKDNPF